MNYFALQMSWKLFIEILLRDFRCSDYELANRTGISQPAIHRIKSGQTGQPTQHTLKRLEDGLQIKIDDSDPENITYTRVDAGAVADKTIIKEDQVKYLSDAEVKEYIELTDEIIENMKRQISELEKKQKEIKDKQRKN